MLWYSAVNEDSTPERTALSQWNGRTVVVVAGSGERVIALLDAPHIDHVIIVDQNSDAIDLARIKIEALRFLNVDEYLTLLGQIDATGNERHEIWDRLGKNVELPRVDPSPGLQSLGALERWFDKLRPLTIMWLGKTFERWVAAGMPSTLPPRFPHRRFSWLMWLFRHPITYRLTGNHDPAFVGSGASYERVARSFEDGKNDGVIGRNPMAHLVFAGHLRYMRCEHLPASYRRDVLEAAKTQLKRIRFDFVIGDLCDDSVDAALLWKSGAEPVFSSLSDIPSFVSLAECERIIDRATRNAGSVVILRSFLRHRLYASDGGEDLSNQEHTGMYDVHAYPSVPS